MGVGRVVGGLAGRMALGCISRGDGVFMATNTNIQYISDTDGNTTGVIVPIGLWREIESERETAYLLRSEAMKTRLLEAKSREEGIAFEDARARLAI